MTLVSYALGLAVFVAIFLYLRQHPDWSRGSDGRPFSAPGWWKPLAIGWFALVILLVVYAAVENGFSWGMLLVFPILGAAFALGLVLLSLLARRN
jgi:hypothetical protein